MAVIVNRSVTSGEMPIQIPDGAVTTTKLADESVTTAKIDDDAITTAKILAGAVTSAKLTFSHSTDANGWTVMPIASNVNVYMKSGTASATSIAGNTWTEYSVASAPVALNTGNTFFGVTSGKALDNALNLAGKVSLTSGDVSFQAYNAYGFAITTTFEWSAIIVELTA